MVQTSATPFNTITSYNFLPDVPPCWNQKIHEFHYFLYQIRRPLVKENITSVNFSLSTT